MSKKIFIGAIPGKTIKSPVIKGFTEDLKYSVELKFGEGKIVFSDSFTNSDLNVFIIPEGGKTEKIDPNSKNFYINFSADNEAVRSRFYIDLSEYIDKKDDESQQDTYWNAITDIIFQLDQQKESDKKYVFVSEASEDQSENRRSIVRELEQKGFSILPEKPIGKDALSRIKEDLNKSEFSIHIIGEDELSFDIGEDKDLVFLQNEVASRFASEKKDFKRYIYIPSNINPTKSQLIKIEKVKRKPANLVGAEIIESGIEKFKSELFQKVFHKKAKHEIVDMEGNLIYIINGVNFKTETKAIRKKLEDASIDLVAIDSFDDSLDFLHQHKGNLLKASSILIINSENNNYWLSSMLDDVLKSYGFGKQRAFDLVGIITKEKLQYFSQMELINFLEINDSTTNPTEDSLRSFLKAVKDAGH